MEPILVKERTWVRVGRRIARATPACLARCCNGCPLWRKLLQCPNGPTCIGEVPPQRELWICDTVRCEDNPNEPLYSPLNRTVRIDEICWTVTNMTAPVPPLGADIVEGNDPVRCVGFSACADEACPQGELFLLATPCNPSSPPRYFCGVTLCGIYRDSNTNRCYLVDPATGYIPGRDLPPGSVVGIPANIDPFATCCECNDSLECNVCPKATGAVDEENCYLPLGPGGIPQVLLDSCCRSLQSCNYVTNWRTIQTFNGFPQGVPLTIVMEIVDLQTDTQTGDQTGQIRTTFTYVDRQDVVNGDRITVGGCGDCATLLIRPPRLTENITQTVYAEECVPPAPTPFQVITVRTWFNRYGCDGQDNIHEYLNVDPDANRSITTRFEYNAVIVDTDPTNPCRGQCAGRSKSSAKRGDVVNVGCATCGQSRTTRVL